MHDYETIDSKEIYKGPSYSLTLDSYRLPEGQIARTEKIHHRGGVCVIAFNSKGEIPLVRQYRYGIGQWLWEIPAGKLDKIPGETPAEGARRELQEETGCVAEDLILLGEFYPTPGMSHHVQQAFMAKISSQGKQALDEDEQIEVKWFTCAQVRSMIAHGEIRDCKTICAFALASFRHLI